MKFSTTIFCCIKCYDFIARRCKTEMDLQFILELRREKLKSRESAPKRWRNTKHDRAEYVIATGSVYNCRRCGENKKIANSTYCFCSDCTKKEQFFGEQCDVCKAPSDGNVSYEYSTGRGRMGRGLFCNKCRQQMLRYGIGKDELTRLNSILECESCGIELSEDPHGLTSRCIDHDHETLLVRGVLCLSCNASEGYLSKLPISAEEWSDRLEGYLSMKGSGLSIVKDDYTPDNKEHPIPYINTTYPEIPVGSRSNYVKNGLDVNEKKECAKCGKERVLSSLRFNFCRSCAEKEAYIGESCWCCGKPSEGDVRFLLLKGERWKSEGLFCYKCYTTMKLYATDIDETRAILQQTTCAICDVLLEDGKHGSKSRVVDHDHITGELRGVLCTTCNKLEGYLGNSEVPVSERIELISNYLARTK